ncbi:hypothetical protein ACFFSW_24210 [Saccharothrix longispora]|uniref:Uncharacterized protein n=1 Tax=Saccharothrix longispora TaxID=33920 RepID=A0ABU1PRH8_9PSEU|nr:hypothetical protein [Saccharothrix longispora]MDR6592719.1 hypothetical protein [Saccharothrix longispora]
MAVPGPRRSDLIEDTGAVRAHEVVERQGLVAEPLAPWWARCPSGRRGS